MAYGLQSLRCNSRPLCKQTPKSALLEHLYSWSIPSDIRVSYLGSNENPPIVKLSKYKTCQRQTSYDCPHPISDWGAEPLNTRTKDPDSHGKYISNCRWQFPAHLWAGFGISRTVFPRAINGLMYWAILTGLLCSLGQRHWYAGGPWICKREAKSKPVSTEAAVDGRLVCQQGSRPCNCGTQTCLALGWLLQLNALPWAKL